LKDSGVMAVALSPGGKILATANWKPLKDGGTNVVKLWHTDTMKQQGEDLSLAGDSRTITCLAFTRDGKLLAAGGEDKTVRIWDATDPSKPPKVLVHASAVRSVAFSPDSKTLASASDEVKLWDMAIGEARAALRGPPGPVWSVTFAADGKTLASGHADGTVRLWEAPRD
jgi:WD40 repeat protein